MALNRELFQKIHDIITAEDGAGFEMSNWETLRPGSGCQTTRCVAGWAVYLETGAELYKPMRSLDDDPEPTPETRALAGRLRSEGARVLGNDDFEEMGAHLLGLKSDQRRLFYSNNHLAAEFVAAAARGDLAEVDRITEEMR